MYSYTADIIFDGYKFLPTSTTIQVAENGSIISINKPENFEAIAVKGLLMPGLINCHCHLELSYLKNQVQPHTGLITFLGNVMQKRNLFSEDEILRALVEAEQEMLQNGIVAVGDICNTNFTLDVKKAKKLRYYSFVECFGLDASKAENIYKEATKLKLEFEEYDSSSVVLHAPYSITDELFNIVDLDTNGKVTTIHNQESDAENELFLKASGPFVDFIERVTKKEFIGKVYGTTSLQHYINQFKFSNTIILVHNTFTNKEDVEFVKNIDKEIYFCLCPKANVYIENTMPPAAFLYQNYNHIVFGTDSLASNDSLCILDELLTIYKHCKALPMEGLLQSATIMGAKALQLESQLGSFEPNKMPGLVQVQNWSEVLQGKEDKFLINRMDRALN